MFLIFLLVLIIKPSLAKVTFQEILENPSDLEINLKYATEQEALGRYKATLSTLERLNMLYPVNTDIKLYLLSINKEVIGLDDNYVHVNQLPESIIIERNYSMPELQ